MGAGSLQTWQRLRLRWGIWLLSPDKEQPTMSQKQKANRLWGKPGCKPPLSKYQVTSGIAIQFGDGLWALHHLASFNLQKGGA